MVETNFCEKQFISGELFSTVLQDSQFGKKYGICAKVRKRCHALQR